jgi:SAM-dependent methyltransferase
MPPIMPPDKAPHVPMLGLKTLWFQVAGTICNLRCSHCFISCSPENDSHTMMTRSQVQRYLAEARELGVEEFYFTGGEPLLNRELPGILVDALHIGPATVLTNGMLITASIARVMREIQDASPHPLEFRVSLDGSTAEQNDAIRGKGVFGKATQGIRNLRAVGFEPIITACQIDEHQDPNAFRRGFEDLARRMGQMTPRLKILPPLFLGALEKSVRPYRATERVTDACFVNYSWESLQCSTCRMVTSEGVYVCPILLDEPTARMGQTIRETLRPFPLAYSACYTCRVQGLSCANPSEPHAPVRAAREVTRADVQQFYAEAALEPKPALCCPGGYEGAETAHIPEEVLQRAYGCGSPMGMAELAPGEIVVDLGSGAGIDVFVAAKTVGKDGTVIGVDMTPEMLAQALGAAGQVARNLGYRNTEFRHGYLEEIPVDDASVDLVTSNCVLNLSTDKGKVFREIGRILRHGGRFVIADIVSEKPVPREWQGDRHLWGECIAGALAEEAFLAAALEAGFTGLQILTRTFYREVAGQNFYALTVRGWKFQKGSTCVYIGQQAIYLGPYAQVSDDDGHTYPRGVPCEICTDTAAKLASRPYGGQFVITGPQPSQAGERACSPSSGGERCC